MSICTCMRPIRYEVGYFIFERSMSVHLLSVDIYIYHMNVMQTSFQEDVRVVDVISVCCYAIKLVDMHLQRVVYVIVFTYVYMCVQACMSICTLVCMCVCVQVHMYRYLYIYARIIYLYVNHNNQRRHVNNT